MRIPSPTSRRSPVPWTPREVGLSVAAVALVYSVSHGLLLHMPRLRRPAVLIGLEFLLLVPVGAVVCWKHHVTWATVGFRTFPCEAIKWGGGALVQFYLYAFVYGLVLMPLHVRIHNPVVSMVKRYSPEFMILLVVMLAPFIEEIFFRGFVFAGLRQRYSRHTSAVMSAVLFALLHLQWTRFVPLAVMGYLLADLYEQSNSLWPPIVTHVLMNAFALGFAYWRLSTGLPR